MRKYYIIFRCKKDCPYGIAGTIFCRKDMYHMKDTLEEAEALAQQPNAWNTVDFVITIGYIEDGVRYEEDMYI